MIVENASINKHTLYAYNYKNKPFKTKYLFYFLNKLPKLHKIYGEPLNY